MTLVRKIHRINQNDTATVCGLELTRRRRLTTASDNPDKVTCMACQPASALVHKLNALESMTVCGISVRKIAFKNKQTKEMEKVTCPKCKKGKV